MSLSNYYLEAVMYIDINARPLETGHSCCVTTIVDLVNV